jgi:uncharacterized membrane protein
MISALIVVATLAYAGALVAFGRGPLHLNSNVFGAILNFIGAMAPVGLYALVSQQRQPAAGDPKTGVTWALFGGACIALFTIALAYVFSTGKNVSFVTPLLYGGAVLLASLVGILVFKERANPLQLLGLLMIVAGIGAIAASTSNT